MKVSILIVSYNQQDYIAEAVDSILCQDNGYDTEIIFIDDCSADKTFEIASERFSKYNNVKLIKNPENLGITKNYQKGFSLCTGEYIFILEGDDYWIDSLKIKKQVEFLDNHPYHSMCFHPYLMQEDNSRIFKPMVFEGGEKTNLPVNCVENSDESLYGINDLIFNEGLIGNFSVCCYRKKCLDQLPAEVFNVLSYDWIINMFMGHFGLLGRINTTMSVYRLSNTATWSQKPYKDRVSDIIDIIPVYDQLLGHQYTGRFKAKIEKYKRSIKKRNSPVMKIQSWTPPLVFKIIKLLVPPALLKRFMS